MSDAERKRSPIWTTAVTLGVLAAICTVLVTATQRVTRERIADNEQRLLQQSLQPVLEGIEYEGELSQSTLVIPAPNPLPGNDEATVYRLYADGRPIAALFFVTARDGYAGPIRLLVGLTADGSVNRARVISHRETPGLGDRIEAGKSDWMEQFGGHALGEPAIDDWKTRRDGGEFDQLSGATVTSRAIVKAIRDTLVYFSEHRDEVFARNDQSSDET